jgi:hypothetical protein
MGLLVARQEKPVVDYSKSEQESFFSLRGISEDCSRAASYSPALIARL